jgi:hypothetical protein
LALAESTYKGHNGRSGPIIQIADEKLPMPTKQMNLKDITLIALTASCFIQTGAQLFAVSIVASTVAEAPPRSLAMLQGEYGYNSTAFWDVVPSITFLLFIIALIVNWKTQRQKLILFSLTLFIIGGIVAALFLEPLFADIIKEGYSDKVDPILQVQARRWFIFDWIVWTLSLVAGLTLLVALTRPLKILPPTAPHR